MTAELPPPAQSFAGILKTGSSERDKFLSRLFGLFSEWVVRDWCTAPAAPYVNRGRPTLRLPGEARGYTLDFALQRPGESGILVAEMKCELEFEDYRYLTLERADQIDHHRSPAFLRFLELSKDPARYEVRVNGTPEEVRGTVLVWGAVRAAGRRAAKDRFRFADVLSVEDMLADLRTWGAATAWPARVVRLRGWSNELFDALSRAPGMGSLP